MAATLSLGRWVETFGFFDHSFDIFEREPRYFMSGRSINPLAKVQLGGRTQTTALIRLSNRVKHDLILVELQVCRT